jgi:hypothetical protein
VTSRGARISAAIDLLLGHAEATSRLAQTVERLEAALLEFAAAPEATRLLSSTIPLTERVDRLRAELVGEIARACRLALELERRRTPQQAVVVITTPAQRSLMAPTFRRLAEA